MPSMVEDLLNPHAFPEETQGVSLIQTHISLVFVADRFVYKIKKPVDFGFLDFSNLEKRRFFCEQEVKLNSRLSRGLYLGVLPVTYDGNHYTLNDGRGRVVEYAVKMKRIPDERLMKSLFRKGELQDEQLDATARVLSEFHRTAAASPSIDEFGRPETFKINTDENFAQTKKYIGTTIEKKAFRALQAWTEDFYSANRQRFYSRISQQKIRDCHGDLHMEHVCFADQIYIFDCIEFNDRFRYSDTLSDIAFLLMDLEFHGGKPQSERIWEQYSSLMQENDAESLLTFYKIYRAYVRGKVTSFQLDDERISGENKANAEHTARQYFQLAHAYAEGGHS